MDEPNLAAPSDGIAVSDNTQGITVQDGSGEQVVNINSDPNSGDISSSNNDTSSNDQGVSNSNEQHQQKEDQLKADVDQHMETLKALEKDLRNKGVDFKQAVKEYEQTGNISDRTIANLVNAGYPKEVIESFLQSRAVLEERFTNAVFEAAGGEQEYFQLTSWAGNHLPDNTLKAFNKAIDSNDIAMISLMLSGIKAQMVSQRGTNNPSILGSTGGAAPSKGFDSKAEMIKAMSDPRYGRDSAYTRSVEQKMYFTTI